MERFENLARSAASAGKPSPFDSLDDFNDVEPMVAKEPENKRLKRATSFLDLVEPDGSESYVPPNPSDPADQKEPAMSAEAEVLVRNVLRLAEHHTGADPTLASNVSSSSDVATSSSEYPVRLTAKSPSVAPVVAKSPSASEADNWHSGWYEGSYWRANTQRYGKRGGKKSAFFTARKHAMNLGLDMKKWDRENQWLKKQD